jgi:hypothetical protein
MTKSPSGRTILCTWEMGSDLGHISRLGAITRALEDKGYNVVLALKDLSRAYPFFKDTQAKLLQAPTWLLKLNMQRPVACQADVLLLSGYVDAEALLMLSKAWQSIVDLVQPDVVVFDYAPTALLALRDDNRGKVIVGTGFAEPVPGHPIADWRHYDTNDDLVAKQEQVALHPINIVLKQLNKKPLQQLSELWQVDKVILNEFHQFDPYHGLRTNAIYCNHQTVATASFPTVEFPDTGRKKIIAYLKPAHAKFELLLQALAFSDADVFVVCPRAPEQMLKRYESEHLRYSTGLVNLVQGLEQADLFLGHGNAGSVKEALIAETPNIVVPLHQEQLLIGLKLQQFGAGQLVVDFDDAAAFGDIINSALNNADLYNRSKDIAQLLNANELEMTDAVTTTINQLLG